MFGSVVLLLLVSLVVVSAQSDYLFNLSSQAFPTSGHPGVLVHVPLAFNPAASQWQLVIFIHGFYNCIEVLFLTFSSSITSAV